MDGLVTAAGILLLLLCAQSRAQTSKQGASIRELAEGADRALQNGDYDIAIERYTRLTRLNPGAAAAWSNLGSAWFAKEQFSKASVAFVRASHLKPDNEDYAFNGALSYVRQDRCDEAQSSLIRLESSTSHMQSALYLRGMCAFVHQEWSQAIDQLNHLVRVGVVTPEIDYMLVVGSRKSQDSIGEKRAFQRLEHDFPDSSFYHELAGEALDRENRDTGAQEQIELAIAESPSAPELHAQLGFLQWKAHRFSEAENAFRKELVIDKQSYAALHYLGDIAEKTNRPDTALDCYQRALRVKPDSGETRFSLGRVLEMKGDSKEALNQLSNALPSMPDDAALHYWLARTYRHLGQTDLADKQLARVRELNEAERSSLLNKLGNGTP